jgi:Na+-transporting NADH:ubiquinone oxidoreductase subunit NqrD
LAFVLGVTDHLNMTVLVGLSLATMLGVWVPVRRFVYKQVDKPRTMYSDLMVWTLIASVLLGFWKLLFFDSSRILSLYVGLLIVVCFSIPGTSLANEEDEIQTIVYKNFGYGLRLGLFLVGVSLFRVFAGHFFGIFAVPSGLFLSLGCWIWYQDNKRKTVE